MFINFLGICFWQVIFFSTLAVSYLQVENLSFIMKWELQGHFMVFSLVKVFMIMSQFIHFGSTDCILLDNFQNAMIFWPVTICLSDESLSWTTFLWCLGNCFFRFYCNQNQRHKIIYNLLEFMRCFQSILVIILFSLKLLFMLLCFRGESRIIIQWYKA